MQRIENKENRKAKTKKSVEKDVAAYSSTLNVEVAGSSETLVMSYQTISHHFTEDVNFHSHPPEKLKSTQQQCHNLYTSTI